MIWIDRGRIKFDGDPKTALNLYESSIKEQEEQRLRKKAVLVGAAQLRDASERRAILIELLPADGRFAEQVDVVDARLMSGPNELVRLRIDQPEFGGASVHRPPDWKSWRKDRAGCISAATAPPRR